MKTWFITGASSGLGRTMTESLLARGDTVAATVRRPDALDELSAKYGDRLRVMSVDLTDTARMRGEVDAAFAALGRIDVVVSNAAYGLFGAVEEVSNEQMERQIATNLIAPMQLVRACLPHLRRQGGGRIVQISSGQVVYPSFGTIAAIIAAADEKRPPLRLALGSAAYEHIEHALVGRLEAVRKQKATAQSADRQRSPA
jgi:NAD(P)-dependent dehydrogenase (short-subunit alcohol dehydrogenase family)